ncbi:putative ribonuclease H-like domain-containing protein, partial [Tanacetum coccineum]
MRFFFCEEVAVLKREASKDLDQLLGSQITDKSKKGLGYSAVPPPHPLIYNRPNKLDLSYSGLDEFKEPEFKGYGPENSKKESNVVCEKESDNSKENSDKSLVKEQESQVKSSFVEGCGSNTSKNVSEVEPKKVRKNNDAPIIEDWVSDDEEQDESKTKPEKKTVIPTAAKIEKPVKKSVRYAEMYRSQRPRGNQRNWNGQKSNQLGSEFVMYNKACFNCGSFKHVQKNCTYHQKKKVVSGNNYNRVDNYYYAKTSHHRTHKNVTPRAVLLRTGLKPLSTAKSVYTAHPKPTVHCARPKTHFYKSAQSTVQRPFYKKPALTNRHFNHKVNTVRPRIVNTARSYRTPVNTVRPRVVNTARSNRTSVNAARANGFNAVKPSACWVWRPIKPNKNVDNGEPKTADDAQKQVEDGLNNENAEQERFADDSSSKDVNAIGAASPNKEENTEEEPEVDLENITNSYIVPTTPNTRIHKDYPINNVIGKVQSTYQTRRMLKPTSEQGFLSDVYEQKIHDT